MMPFLHRLTRVQAEENPLWLVVLCDLMTNLVLFFLVVYSFTFQTSDKRATGCAPLASNHCPATG